MAAAETGSGKTGAFGIPMVQVVHETLRDRQRGGGTKKPKATTAGAAPAAVFNLSRDDRDPQFAVSPTGLECQSRAAHSWAGGRCTAAVTGGRYCYEAIPADDGLCRIGWSTMAAGYDVGADKHSFGYGGTGMKSNSRNYEKFGGA